MLISTIFGIICFIDIAIFVIYFVGSNGGIDGVALSVDEKKDPVGYNRPLSKNKSIAISILVLIAVFSFIGYLHYLSIGL